MSDSNPSLLAQLTAAAAVLAPQLRGLHDLSLVSLSADALEQITQQITARQHRLDLINQVISDIHTVQADLKILENDGYPVPPPPVELANTLISELQIEQSDLEAALAVFAAIDTTAVSDHFDPTNATIRPRSR